MSVAASALTAVSQLAAFVVLLALALGAVAQGLGAIADALVFIMPWALVLMGLSVDLQGAAEVLRGRFWPMMLCFGACAVLGWLIGVFWPRRAAGDGNRITFTWGRG